MKKNISALFFALTGGLIAAVAALHFNNNESSSFQSEETPLHFVSSPLNEAIPFDFTQAAEATLNSVVHIKTISRQENQSIDPFQGFFFGNPYQQRAPQEVSASGSGVIISSDGYIATNNHVVNGATEIEITLNDNSSYKASIIGVDPTTDLALIKIDAENLTPIYYGNSDEVKVGQWVAAVGNPFNLTSTVTAGIVSAKGRNIHILQDQYAIESFIQTDAAVNPGNSGGALVNTKGELIGINTAIASNTGSYTGYAFAIPSNMVKKITSDLLKFGKVQRAMLGVQIRDIDQKLSEEKNLKGIQGVYISEAFDKSSAKEAGLASGDVITKIGLVKITKGSELQEQISQFRPGDKISISYIRNGSEKTADVILKNTNGTTSIVEKDAIALGAKFEQASKEELQKLRIEAGVKISVLEDGKLKAQGIKQGFIITSIDNEAVRSPEELSAKLKNKKGGILLEGVYPNGMKAYYGFGL
jgi:serine protease Do